jgi:hypothetical protein
LTPFRRYPGSIIGPLLDKRIASLAQQARHEPLLAPHFQDVFRSEIAIFEANRLLKSGGRLARGSEFDLAYGFITATQRIFEALRPSGKNTLLGRLRDMTRSPYGARPLSFEVGTAAHMMQQGWAVDFGDLCGEQRFDFLASKGEACVELECKTTSGDTGRRIHRREINRLGGLLTKSTTHDLLPVDVPDFG